MHILEANEKHYEAYGLCSGPFDKRLRVSYNTFVDKPFVHYAVFRPYGRLCVIEMR